MELVQIGVIHTPYKVASGTPIQAVYGRDARGEVEVYPEYAEGLDDIEGFDRIWLLYGADRARPPRLKVVPYRDTVERGVFATRAPSRPNSICISSVRLLERRGNILEIADIDILDGSPLYDIKPYIARTDAFPDAKGGWFEKASGEQGEVDRADERFEGER